MKLQKQISGSAEVGDQVIFHLEELGRMALQSGLQLNLHSPAAVSRLKSLPQNQQENLLAGLSNYLGIFTKALTLIPEARSVEETKSWGINEEFYCLNSALWKYNLFAKVDLKDYIGPGDVIEIYNPDAVQIYRNFEFIKLCSYSLLEIMTLEWFTLYDRPQFVTDLLFKFAHEVFTTAKPVQVQIPEHIMREKHLDARKTFVNRFKYFVPLFEKSDQPPAAFLATMQVQPILEADQGHNVAMLEKRN